MQATITAKCEATAMRHDINSQDLWLFLDVYSVLAAFADDPNRVISRIGAGQIGVADDQANQLHNTLRAIAAKYPGAEDLELIQVAWQIDGLLAERSANEELVDPTFWRNSGFVRHPDWAEIRDLARRFLLR